MVLLALPIKLAKERVWFEKLGGHQICWSQLGHTCELLCCQL